MKASLVNVDLSSFFTTTSTTKTTAKESTRTVSKKNKRSSQLSGARGAPSRQPRAAECTAVCAPSSPCRSSACVTAPRPARKKLPRFPPTTTTPTPSINKTYFSLAWLSDGTLLLLPLAYMLAESSDCHAPVNPSQPPWAQPRHHGDTSSVISHWMPRCSGPARSP